MSDRSSDISMLRPVVERLTSAGVELALGGSGLLLSLGLVQQVRDWDLNTDAPLEQVEAALGAAPRAAAPHGDGPYASAYRLDLNPGGQPVDLMGRFAVRTESGICHMPTVVSGTWRGIPVGSPEVWAVAYRLIGRPQKADLLSAFLAREGARPQVTARLLQEPLPAPVRAEVEAWPLRSLSGSD